MTNGVSLTTPQKKSLQIIKSAGPSTEQELQGRGVSRSTLLALLSKQVISRDSNGNYSSNN